MKIHIETEALQHPENNLFRNGTLYGLKHLEELGHTLHFDPEKLSGIQQQLLEQEQIKPASRLLAEEKTDLRIMVKGKKLAAYTVDGDETLLETENWLQLSNAICFPVRKASRTRKTSETDISIDLNLDGTGKSDIQTGLGFFDHMLEQIARHGLIDLHIQCRGDLDIDEHHTIEDVAITLGETISEALGKKVGIQRYAFALPMDESKCQAVLDISGRPYLVFEGEFKREMVGDFPTEMAEHFFYSLAINMKATLHISFEGSNDHHKLEACFKAFARCLRAAVSRSERNLNILPSTKDLL